MEKRRQPEIIAGRVNSDGTIAAGDGFTVSLSGVTYTVTFTGNFRLIAVTASETVYNAATTPQVVISSITDRSFQFTLFINTAGGAGTNAFSFIAVGVQQ